MCYVLQCYAPARRLCYVLQQWCRLESSCVTCYVLQAGGQARPDPRMSVGRLGSASRQRPTRRGARYFPQSTRVIGGGAPSCGASRGPMRVCVWFRLRACVCVRACACVRACVCRAQVGSPAHASAGRLVRQGVLSCSPTHKAPTKACFCAHDGGSSRLRFGDHDLGR